MALQRVRKRPERRDATLPRGRRRAHLISMRITPAPYALGITLLLAALATPIRSSRAQSNPQSQQVPAATQVEMQNVMYRFSDEIAVHIVRMKGQLAPSQPGGIPTFDTPASFNMTFNSAEVAIDSETLAKVLNTYVFAAADAPVKRASVEIAGQVIKIKGILPSKGGVSFETDGTLSATPNGEIRVHSEKIKMLHMQVKGIMKALGITVAGMISTKKVQGVRADGDDLLLTPDQIFPPPHFQGRVTNVRIEGNNIIQIYGAAPAPADSKSSGNFMAFRGGTIRFGKLTMQDADVQLIDLDPRDPFDFFLDRYLDQLSSGYQKITPSFGVRAYMKDYDKLPKAPPKRGKREHS